VRISTIAIYSLKTLFAGWATTRQLAKDRSLLKRMTLEEKVGQMTQLAIGMIATGQDQTIQIDRAKLDKAIGNYGVGSILNVHEQALTVDKWHEIIDKFRLPQRKRVSGFR